jgi:hypothetical protein
MIEVDSYIEKGFVKILPLKTVRQRFCEGKASCLALKIKQKANGSTKRGPRSTCERPLAMNEPGREDILTSSARHRHQLASHES